jgi:hypothetical protein
MFVKDSEETNSLIFNMIEIFKKKMFNHIRSK